MSRIAARITLSTIISTRRNYKTGTRWCPHSSPGPRSLGYFRRRLSFDILASPLVPGLLHFLFGLTFPKQILKKSIYDIILPDEELVDRHPRF